MFPVNFFTCTPPAVMVAIAHFIWGGESKYFSSRCTFFSNLDGLFSFWKQLSTHTKYATLVNIRIHTHFQNPNDSFKNNSSFGNLWAGLLIEMKEGVVVLRFFVRIIVEIYLNEIFTSKSEKQNDTFKIKIAFIFVLFRLLSIIFIFVFCISTSLCFLYHFYQFCHFFIFKI